MTFGEKIQKLRKEKGFSQEELAEQLGVSRQAISKWERDSGYPEIEKIIHMSKIFKVTLDYLLNEDTRSEEVTSDEKGIYVSYEMAEGFLIYQKQKNKKISIGVGIIIAASVLAYLKSPIGMLIRIALQIVGVILFVAAKLSDNPYRRVWEEPLLFDKEVKNKLNTMYTDVKQKAYPLIFIGIGLITFGILGIPVIQHILSESIYDWYDEYTKCIMGIGTIVMAIGIFLCIYEWGIIKSYRLLVMNHEYLEKR